MNSRQKKMFIALIISSILMFSSIFTLSYKVLGFGLLQWVVVVFLAFNSTMLKRFSFAEFASYNGKIAAQSWQEKKFVKSATHALATPMVAIGLMFIVLMVGVSIIYG